MYFLFWISPIFLFLFVLIRRYLYAYKDYWRKLGVKCIEPDSKLTLRLLKGMDILQFDNEYYNKMGAEDRYVGIVELRNPVLILKDPNLIQKILVDDCEHFVNRRTVKSNKILKDMLFFKENTEWKELRSNMNHTLTKEKVKKIYQILDDITNQFIQYLNFESRRKEIFDFQDLFSRLSMDAIAIAFGIHAFSITDPAGPFNIYGLRLTRQSPLRSMKYFLNFTIPKFFNLFRIPTMDRKASRFFLEALTRAVKLRERSTERKPDFLQFMVDAKRWELEVDENLESAADDYEKEQIKGQRKIEFSDDLIISQCFQFLIGGLETTRSLIMLAVYQLALHPEMQSKLAEEVKKAYKENDGKLSYDLINNLDYLDRFISETLRMYPPYIRTERTCTKEYNIPGSDVTVPKGTRVLIPIYCIQRDSVNFADPDTFNPDRFFPENRKKFHPFSYLPFGRGFRSCLGMRFSETEAKLAIAKLVMNFTFEPCKETPIPLNFFTPTGVLYCKGGIKLKMTSNNQD